MARVVINGLTKKFNGGNGVEDLHLTIEDGEFVSLLGPSGCGKTTTLRLLAGFTEPDSGEILVDGRCLSSTTTVVPPERRRMSMIFQSYAVWPHKTVFDNVAFGLKVRHATRAEIGERVTRMLKLVRLVDKADRYPGELSGGQQQRVALARALVVDPEILLLDEPLSNLDANLREEMRFEIRRLHDQVGITTVYVTHDRMEALATSDRVAVMRDGRLDQVGAPEEVFNYPRTRFVASFISRTNCVEGSLVADGRVDCGGTVLKAEPMPGARPAALSRVIVFIPPRSITLHSRGTCGAVAAAGLLEAEVLRKAYLGESTEYLLSVKGFSESLRAVAPPGHDLEGESAVRVTIDQSKCRVIPAGRE